MIVTLAEASKHPGSTNPRNRTSYVLFLVWLYVFVARARIFVQGPHTQSFLNPAYCGSIPSLPCQSQTRVVLHR